MKKILIFLVSALLLLFLPQKVEAQANSINCNNRYVTLVNPVRGRSLWSDKTLKPLEDQYNAASKYGFPITWLMQYDAISDKEVAGYIKNLGISGEKGIFLEISKDLADEAGVEFNTSVRWSHPGVVFLSGYTQTERRLLIDTLYKKFKSQFGYYPKSVGAWWIDSYSLNYIKDKYGLESILIVADQKTTDSYGVWGGWWGYPYIPSKSNLLIPADNKGLGAVVVQWAQRDPTLAYGDDPNHSNYSLQANDYIRQGKNTDYFKSLSSIYLDCRNHLGQITIGMETGMEASDFEKEYENQLAYLSTRSNFKFLTMSDFSQKYKEIYNGKNPPYVSIADWEMDKEGRANQGLNDYVYYPKNFAFNDYFLADKSDFLKRVVDESRPTTQGSLNILFFLVIAAVFVICIKAKLLNLWIAHLLFVAAAFGLLYRSGQFLGWFIYYGFLTKNLFAIQVIVYLSSFLMFLFLAKIIKYQKNLLLFLLPLTFGIDGFFSLIRITTLGGQKLIGLVLGTNYLIGVTYGTNGLKLISETFPFKTLSYFYKFPFEKIFTNIYLYLFLSPIVHILAALALYLILARNGERLKNVAVVILAVFYVVFLIIIHTIDPVAAIAIQN